MKAIYQLYTISLGFSMFYTGLISLIFRFQFWNTLESLEDPVPLITVGNEHPNPQTHFEILCLSIFLLSVHKVE